MDFATAALALYVGHHVGDYWVQTDRQARLKGEAGGAGRYHCTLHVLTYLMTQVVCLMIAGVVTGQAPSSDWVVFAAMLISGGTHYLADRREHGLMFWLARRIPGKSDFLRLGAPRGGHYDDNPSLGTGAAALDQSWHLFFGVFVSALVISL